MNSFEFLCMISDFRFVCDVPMFEVKGGGEGSVLAYEAIMAQMFERKSC